MVAHIWALTFDCLARRFGGQQERDAYIHVHYVGWERCGRVRTLGCTLFRTLKMKRDEECKMFKLLNAYITH